MPALTRTQKPGFEKLDVLIKDSKRIEQLRTQRQALEGNIYEGLERAETIYGRLSTANLEEAQRELSALEKGLNKYGEFKQTMADLAAGLTDGLQGYVEFTADSRNFQGVERLISWVPLDIAQKTAHRWRVRRVRTQSPKQTLQQILDYATQLYEETLKTIIVTEQTFTKLQLNGNIITTKIAEYEPQEATLKERLDAMESEYTKLNEKYNTASAQEQAKLVTELDQQHAALTEVRREYDQVLTVYNQAQQALEFNRKARDSFEQMARDLRRQATMIKEKVDNVTTVYLAAPEAVKVMLTTAGMEMIDKGMNVAADRSIDIITESASAVMLATTDREKIQLIDEQAMRGYIDRVNEMTKEFAKRMDEIRASAQKPQTERYIARPS